MPASISFPVDSNEQNLPDLQEIEGLRSFTSIRSFYESTDNRTLDFAPFMPPRPSAFDSDPTIYDSLQSPTIFGWNMANMWMPNFESDPLASADLGGLSDYQANMSHTFDDYFNENSDANDAYQQ